VESFVSFKRLMLKRNTELNEQAMKAFANKGQSATPGTTAGGDLPQEPSMAGMNPES
jgi:hypothetical protein